MNDLKLNLGSGRHVLSDGWTNVDLEVSPHAPRAPDIIADVRKLDMLPDGCASEILAIHIWEHFYQWETEEVIEEWRRLLRPGGLLTMEMPDLYKACSNIVTGRKGSKEPDQLGMWALYGDPRERNPLMVHKWSWTFATIEPFLRRHGFKDIVEQPTQWHSVGRLHRDFRVQAYKDGA